MTGPLVVLLEGRVAGRVERTRSNVLRLTYDSAATATGRTPLSLSMPLAGESFTGDVVERFLAALLPESPGAVAAIERRHPGVDRREPLSLLAAVGRDCPGAVQLCRPEDVEDTLARTGALEPQSPGEIEQRLAALRIDENASWSMPGEHWSLGGTQPKFALRRIEDDWFEAHGSQPTSHILKPGVRGMRAQSLVEHVSMRAAAACGIEVAQTEHLEFRSETAIVVERFDRAQRDGELVRLHQEDLCQALGVGEKYEEYGGPDAGALVRLLREQSATAAAARSNVRRLVDGVVLSVVIAAPDAHARNYAVLLRGHDVTLAPLFDVSTALPYDPAPGGRVLSMSVGGELVAERVTRAHWQRFADENGLDEQRLLDRVQEVADVAPGAMLAAIGEYDDWDGAGAALRARLAPALDTHVRTVTGNLSR